MKRVISQEMSSIPLDSRGRSSSKKEQHERLTASREEDEIRENRQREETALEIPSQRRRKVITWIKEVLNLYVKPDDSPRTVPLGLSEVQWSGRGFPNNAINNRRYSFLTFLPLALLEQFSNFFNIFYLFLAFSQLIPALKVGFLFTYFSPLVMVVVLSLMKDAVDEINRYIRDRSANRELFEKIIANGKTVTVCGEDIKVGDLLLLHHNQRIPADCILLHTSEQGGTCFIRTDQLDGETDWKLRYPLKVTKNLNLKQIASTRINIRCEALHKDIYQFAAAVDTISGQSEAVSLENTLWSSCVVASGTLAAVVIHTGRDTRMAMNSARPAKKLGLIEHELNFIGVLCFVLLFAMSFMLVVQQRFEGNWVVMFVRFFILLSAVIPISMRVNVDVGRLWYCHEIEKDGKIDGTIARNTDMPEELGRLQYLFCDKTGTLTKNKMEFRFMAVGPNLSYSDRDRANLKRLVASYFASSGARTTPVVVDETEMLAVGEMLVALVLCHNVNPVMEEGELVDYQASSPDEVALVKFCKEVGLVLTDRTADTVTFQVDNGKSYTYEIVKLFPFTSERKSMGVIVKKSSTLSTDNAVEYKYLMKGADTKMLTVMRHSDWIDECIQEVAQLGLRTLVFASRTLTESELHRFVQEYDSACAIMGEGRHDYISKALSLLERDLHLLGVTGVEDELQDDVVVSLETLGMCGIKVWILTGDKVETATTIGRSTRLIPRYGSLETILCKTAEECYTTLIRLKHQYEPSVLGEFLATPWTLVMDGTTLSFCLSDVLSPLFATVAQSAHGVIIARCSPTQKASVVQTMRRHSSSEKVRMAAIGDGGNDVAMILAANVGIGIEGVEGKQASMAADFSITQFSYCLRLIMWHGRNSYRRTCRMSQFIMHRGIVYSVVQAVFSLLFAGTTMSVFNGYLLMGYSTIFTMAPAFALVMDEDFRESDINEYPQLYKELVKGRSMNTRTFLQWVWASFFQGGVMLYVSLEQFSDEMFQITTIAYTSLLISELIIVGSTAHLRTLWHQHRSHFWLYILAEVFSLTVFFIAVLVLPDTFDRSFFFSWSCWWKVGVICAASIGPLIVFHFIAKRILFNPKFVSSFVY